LQTSFHAVFCRLSDQNIKRTGKLNPLPAVQKRTLKMFAEVPRMDSGSDFGNVHQHPAVTYIQISRLIPFAITLPAGDSSLITDLVHRSI
jgi:hypothetical protein